MNNRENFLKGIFKENPVFVLLLGLCPVLGVTTTLMNGLGMGLAFTFVLVMSNIIVSLLRRFIPNEVRIPAFIVIIATLVTIVDMMMNAYLITLYDNLGIFIPLIVVNCIVLGRAEAFASKNNPFKSILDALGMGIGFTLAVGLLSFIRELLGSGTIIGYNIIPFGIVEPAILFILAPGAFITLGLILATMNAIKAKRNKSLKANS